MVIDEPVAPTSAPPTRRPAWLTKAVVGAVVLSGLSGLAQFSITATAGDVAETFGQQTDGVGLSDQIGLTATTLGVALAVIRSASLLGLAGGVAADRWGRRRVVLLATAAGLAFTGLSAGSPGFWSWVLLAALARPWLTTVNQVTGVMAAEETDARGRAWAVALVGGAYGLGAGVVAVTRGVLGDPSFRLIMLLAALPLVVLPLLRVLVHEPDVFDRTHATPSAGLPGAVPPEVRRRLWLIASLFGALALVTGPGFTYLFVYGEQVLGATPGQMSWIILAAGPVGLTGLLLGRYSADKYGRRPTSGVAMALTAASLIIAYSGRFDALAAGYLAGIAASGAFGPPAGALLAEAFPTSVRATVAGWATVAGVLGAVGGLAIFGVLADALGGFEPAAIALAVPVAIAAAAFALVPETLGQELDETPLPSP